MPVLGLRTRRSVDYPPQIHRNHNYIRAKPHALGLWQGRPERTEHYKLVR